MSTEQADPVSCLGCGKMLNAKPSHHSRQHGQDMAQLKCIKYKQSGRFSPGLGTVLSILAAKTEFFRLLGPYEVNVNETASQLPVNW